MNDRHLLICLACPAYPGGGGPKRIVLHVKNSKKSNV